MNDYLLGTYHEVRHPLKKQNLFMCPYCTKTYSSAIVHFPVRNLSPFFSCLRCESVYPFHQIKEVNQWKVYFGCFCCF